MSATVSGCLRAIPGVDPAEATRFDREVDREEGGRPCPSRLEERDEGPPKGEGSRERRPPAPNGGNGGIFACIRGGG